MKRFAVIILAMILIVAASAFAADFDAYVYWVPSGTKRTISWSAIDGADGYEVKIHRLESDKDLYSGNITTNSITITWRTLGHYIANIRSYQTINGIKTYSPWGSSLDPLVGEVNGKPRAWVVLVPTN